ncbi:hypothetical protein [Exiguobacterium sp. s102]|uniref:hypothetical protein n=1 Tax=Exiguobacterium sp. s102 TaxID=2751212 RepID=UPI001BEA0024|nr:hypothetical protein [Exiguobacterium sp. s102]
MDPQLASLAGRVDRLEISQAEMKEEHKKLEKSDDRMWEFMRELKAEFATHQKSQLEVNIKVSDLATGQQAMRSEMSEANGRQEATLNIIKESTSWYQQQLATREEHKDKRSDRRWATAGKLLVYAGGILTAIGTVLAVILQ